MRKQADEFATRSRLGSHDLGGVVGVDVITSSRVTSTALPLESHGGIVKPCYVAGTLQPPIRSKTHTHTTVKQERVLRTS